MHAGRVFRLYVKSLHDKAVYRSEESLMLNQLLPEAYYALDNIRHPYKSLENKVDGLTEQFKQSMNSFSKCNCNHSCNEQ
jgi:hypothetical protein